ncbi:MAG: hypothetical protein PVH88_12960 [Ignavibacteria bacterium]|jgi:hypothetical protein
MEISIARCGCDCSNCPTYKDNISTIEERRRCSSGWAKYLNIKLNPEKLIGVNLMRDISNSPNFFIISSGQVGERMID